MLNVRSRKNVFVLPSYVGIPHLLRIVAFDDEDNIFLSNHPTLRDWLESVGANVMETPDSRGDYSRKSIVKMRDGNKEVAAKFKNCNVHYFFYLSNIPMLHLLKLLSKNNVLHFVNMDPQLAKTSIWNLNLKDFKKFGTALVAYGLILNLWPDIYRKGSTFMLGKKISKALKTKIESNRPILASNLKYLRNREGLQGTEILYIDNISRLYPDRARRVAVLLQKIRNMGHRVHIKPHPTFHPIREFDVFPQLPAAIPSEICVYSAKIILGVSSSTLNEPVSAKVISLMNLLEFSEKDQTWLRGNIPAQQIVFVNSEAELFHEINASNA